MNIQTDTKQPTRKGQEKPNLVIFKYICPSCGWQVVYAVDGESTINVRKVERCPNRSGCGKTIVLELTASAVCEDDQKKSV